MGFCASNSRQYYYGLQKQGNPPTASSESQASQEAKSTQASLISAVNSRSSQAFNVMQCFSSRPFSPAPGWLPQHTRLHWVPHMGAAGPPCLGDITIVCLQFLYLNYMLNFIILGVMLKSVIEVVDMVFLNCIIQ